MGCICIGMEDKDKKYFCKIAGADTIGAEMSPAESVALLKEAVHLYYDLQHPNLIKIIEEYEYRQFYVVVFKWAEWFGTKRLKAPEEYDKGSVIDEQTNIFTLGALLFEFFGIFSEEEIRRRYQDNRFSPCLLSNWQLNKESYEVAKKAVSLNKNSRYLTFAEFFEDWKKAVERIRINE